jgi:FkbM family methyltransferase
MSQEINHHPIFSKLNLQWNNSASPKFTYDFLGIKTDPHMIIDDQAVVAEQLANNISVRFPPPINEEYFEYVDLFEAILSADTMFTMIELGAGYGRWLVRGVAALRQTRNIPYKLVGVEAEPQHFQWMIQHLQENGIDPSIHTLINKAVSYHDGEVWFTVGDAVRHYGQAIVNSGEYYSPDFPTQKAEQMPCVCLSTILKTCGVVDIIDMDVQGAEYEVLAAATSEICAKVKRIHIGTHGKEIENNLRQLFNSLGWINIFDYSIDTDVDTEYGPVHFGDGVQSWLNPFYINKTFIGLPNNCDKFVASTNIFDHPANPKSFNVGLRSKLL